MKKSQFSTILKKNRVKLKLTQSDIAKLTNVSTAAVSKWELGAAEPDQNTLLTLSNYFNISIDELLGNSLQKNSNEKKTLLKTMLNESDTSIMFSSGSSIDELSDEAIEALLKEVSGFIDVKIAMQSKK